MYKMRKTALISTLLLLFLVVSSFATGVFPKHMKDYILQWQATQLFGNRVAAMPNVDYKKEMILLIEKISTYSKARKPSFQVIGNNGLGLFEREKVGDESLGILLKSVDGIIMEGFHYGWEMKDNARTTASVRGNLDQSLVGPIAQKLPILNIDYCNILQRMDRSYQFNDESGFIGFAADSRQLDTIPDYPKSIHHENDNNISNLRQVKNFIVLFNPHAFSDKQSYLERLRKTNYDLLIIDLYFNGDLLTPCDVASLKVKKNGASRLVFSYMSIGEAEDYRSYWDSTWSTKPPKWMAEKNPDWPGNYKVKYWTSEWKNILYGSPNAYLDKVLAAGFDGTFLDVVDAFEYFEEK